MNSALWAFIAVLVPVLGGAYAGAGAARPDVLLAYVAASSARRPSPVAFVPLVLALCAARLALSPPDALGECLGFLAAGAALMVAHRVLPVRNLAGLLLSVTGAFLSLALIAAVWEKGMGTPGGGLPPLAQLACSLALTAAASAAFSILLAAPEERP